MAVWLLGAGLALARLHAQPELVLVEPGRDPAPLVLVADAPPFLRQATDHLAALIDQATGMRPPILEGEPDPLPDSAIWVGHQPVLDRLFPDVDFDFQRPEEILIAANESHLVIAGRDRWDPDHLRVDFGHRTINGIQREYGTINAVYTFLQNYLDVRWLWPGELGEDVVAHESIAFAPFEYRYHPVFRSRAGVFYIYNLHRQHGGHEWTRYQRCQLDSLYFDPGHPFSNWWDRFHETNPEFFALQPDGSRGGGERPWPGAHMVKICKSNPAVWDQWLADVETSLARNPNRLTFGANANDGAFEGYCICQNCLAWDHPEAPMMRYTWQGLSQEHVAMTDRQITFANTLARRLKERFPDRELFVSAMAYGNSVTPPVQAVPDNNVIVSGVFSFHNLPHERGRELFAAWRGIAPTFAWRPNLGDRAGWQRGLPNVAPRRVIDDLRLAEEYGVTGLFFDSVYGHWANQAPHYYMLAQMAWNPHADGEAILADYYQRAFGPAVEPMTAYWTLLEQAADAIVFQGKTETEAWDDAFYTRAFALLDQAARATAEATEKYGRRIAFVRAGLDCLRLLKATEPLITRLRNSNGQDAEAEAQARANWEEISRLNDAHPFAVHWNYFQGWNRRSHPDHYR